MAGFEMLYCKYVIPIMNGLHKAVVVTTAATSLDTATNTTTDTYSTPAAAILVSS